MHMGAPNSWNHLKSVLKGQYAAGICYSDTQYGGGAMVRGSIATSYLRVVHVVGKIDE